MEVIQVLSDKNIEYFVLSSMHVYNNNSLVFVRENASTFFRKSKHILH